MFVSTAGEGEGLALTVNLPVHSSSSVATHSPHSYEDFSPPKAARPFFCELQTLQPAAAKSATHKKSLRTAVGSEESRKQEI